MVKDVEADCGGLLLVIKMLVLSSIRIAAGLRILSRKGRTQGKSMGIWSPRAGIDILAVPANFLSTSDKITAALAHAERKKRSNPHSGMAASSHAYE